MQKSHSIVGVLASWLILAASFCAAAPQQAHVTSKQVTYAVQEVEKLSQKQIDQNAVPGLAIAVVFQDKVVYAKGFGVRDVNTKARVDSDTVLPVPVATCTPWLPLNAT